MMRKNANESGKQVRRTGRRANKRPSGLVGDNPPPLKVDVITRSVAYPTCTRTLTVRRVAPAQQLLSVGGTANAAVINFALNGVAGSSTFQDLYDLYRIDAIRMTITPNNTGVDLNNPSATTMLPLYWVIDYNDSTPLASVNEATGYENCLVLSPGEKGTRTFRPKYKYAAYSASGTDYISDVGKWLNTSADDIFHYGVKFYIPAAAAGQTAVQTWTVSTEYYFTFSQLK